MRLKPRPETDPWRSVGVGVGDDTETSRRVILSSGFERCFRQHDGSNVTVIEDASRERRWSVRREWYDHAASAQNTLHRDGVLDGCPERDGHAGPWRESRGYESGRHATSGLVQLHAVPHPPPADDGVVTTELSNRPVHAASYVHTELLSW
jgi:hypothetical protein